MAAKKKDLIKDKESAYTVQVKAGSEAAAPAKPAYMPVTTAGEKKSSSAVNSNGGTVPGMFWPTTETKDANRQDPDLQRILNKAKEIPPAGMDETKLKDYYQKVSNVYDAYRDAYMGMQWSSADNEKKIADYEKKAKNLQMYETQVTAYLNWYRNRYGKDPLADESDEIRDFYNTFGTSDKQSTYISALKDRAQFMSQFGSQEEADEYISSLDKYENYDFDAANAEKERIEKILGYPERGGYDRYEKLKARYENATNEEGYYFKDVDPNYDPEQMATDQARKEIEALTKAYGFEGYYDENDDWVSSTEVAYKRLQDLNTEIATVQQYQQQKADYEKAEKIETEARNSSDFAEGVELGKQWLKTNSSGLVAPNLQPDIGKINNVDLTAEERNVLLYLYGQGIKNGGGLSAFNEYYEALQNSVNQRTAQRYYSYIENNKALEEGFGVIAGLDQFAQGMKNWFNDEATPPSAIQQTSAMVRNDLQGAWQVGYDLITTTANMLPAVAAGTVANLVLPGSGAFVNAGLLGFSAGGQAYQEMLNAGFSRGQAYAYGIINGSLEAGLEYALNGIAALGKTPLVSFMQKNMAKFAEAFSRGTLYYATHFIGESVSEGVEEFLQEVMDPFIWNTITGSWKLDEYGNEKVGVDWGEALYSGLLGMLSAVPFNLVSGVHSNASNYDTVLRAVKNGDMGTLIELAKSFGEDTNAYKLADLLDAEAKKYSIKDKTRAAMMVDAMTNEVSTQIESTVRKQLEAEGVSGVQLERMTEILSKAVNEGGKISKKAETTLSNMESVGGRSAMSIAQNVFRSVYDTNGSLANQINTLSQLKNRKGKAGNFGIDFAAYDAKIRENEEKIKQIQKEALENRSRLSLQSFGVDFDNVQETRVSKEDGVVPRRIESLSSDGKMRIRLENGSIVDADSVKYKDMSTALAYEAVRKTGASVKDANSLLAAIRISADFKSSDVATQVRNVIGAYRMGLNGQTFEAVSGTPEQALRRAYNVGSEKAAKYNKNKTALENYNKRVASGQKIPEGHAEIAERIRNENKAIDEERRTLAGMSAAQYFKSQHPDAEAENQGTKRQQKKDEKATRRLEKLTSGESSANVEMLGIDKSTLTLRQRRSILAVNAIAAAVTKNKIVCFESYVNDAGKRVLKTEIKTAEQTYAADSPAPNGIFDPVTGTIYLDINSGNSGQGAIMWTAAHEFTHFIIQWNAEKYEALAEFLNDTYGKHGESVEERVKAQQEKAKNNGRELSYEAAYEEFVADSMSELLTDTDAIERLAELRQKDRSLYDKMRDFFRRIANKVRALYKDMDADSTEALIMRQFGDELQRFAELFSEALVGAGENFAAAGVSLNTKTESAAPVMSERTWTESEYVQNRKAAADALAKALGVTKTKALKYIDDVNGIAKMIADDRTRLDYVAAEGLSAFVSNVEYGGSFDFSTLCAKRRYITGTIQAIQAAIGEGVLSPIDILKIRNMMKERKYVVNCGLCYVEGSRSNMGKFAKEFIARYQKHNPDATWVPKMQDVFTPVGIENMRTQHPEVYEQYEKFWNNHGRIGEGDTNLFASQQKPKQYQMRTDYKNEITNLFKDKDQVKAKNDNGGIRIQSFSDFELVHAIDMMQVIMDMSRVGLAGQAYTKVPEFAWMFGNTGLKINLSLIAKGVEANGNLIFDDVEGMPHDEAFNIRDNFSKNVGTILVTFDDAQLKAAMADPRIDFIIPFHRSQWKKAQYADLGLPSTTKDYTFMQNEKFLSPKFHEWNGKQVKTKATNYMPNTYWDFRKSGKENAEDYLRMCAAEGKRPKFYKLLDAHPDGSFTLKKDGSTDGYWKLLIDFKMYDNEGVGSPQQAVRPDFNIGGTGNADIDSHSIQTLLDAYEGGHDTFPVAEDVVEDFTKEYKKANKNMLSDRDSEAIDSGLAAARASGNQQDVDYFTALKNGDMRTAARMVAEKALGKNVFLDKNGKPLKLYHGTDSFGFTSFRTPLIFTTPDEGVAAGYANGKGYADPRRISDTYIPDDGTDKTLISNVKNVLHRDAREITDADLNQVKDEFQKAATEWRDRVNEAWDYKEGFPEMPIDINNGLDYMMIIAGEIEENLADMFTGDYPFSELEYSIERYNEEREKVRSWFGEHREEILAAGNEDLYRLVVGYDYTDFLIDVEYRLLPAFHADEYLINNNGKFASKEILRASVEQYRSLGAYTLYGMMGSKPLEIDAKGAFWTDIDASALGGEKWSTEEIAMEAQKQGYTSLVIRNVMDPAMNNYSPNRRADEYIFFSPETVKSADPITYDDNGNIIPLSERFSEKDSDIRFSTRNEVLNLDGVDWMDDFSTIRTQLKKHKDKIAKLSPVASVQYGGETKQVLEDLITQQVKKIGGERFVRNGISFNFDKTGVHNLVLHAKGEYGRAAAILAPYVAKRGIIIAGHKNHENNNTTTLTYAAPVIINGNSAHVGVAVMFTTDGRAHAVNVEFLDTVSGQQKKKPASGLRSRTSHSYVSDLLTNADSNNYDITNETESQEKLSDRDKATMTEERIDWLIRDNGAGKRTDYARGWITSISPTDFINLTTKEFTDRSKFDSMKNDYGTTMADYDYMRELKENQRETPYLAVDMNTGEVVGHEGRHRMRALEQASVTSVPIKIEYRDENGYVAKEKNGYGNPLTTIAEQALTNQYGNGYTASVENVMPLMQAMRDEIVAAYGQEDSAIRFSDRDENATDARTLLSNALLTTAQNDIERQKLEDYQAKIEAMNAEQQKLTDLRAQIRELSFSKGPRDNAKLQALREEAVKTANRVTNYDRQLLRLEASKPLARVVDELTKQKTTSAVAKARKQERAKAQAKYERYEAEIEHRKEMRLKERDQRASSDLREKIRDLRNTMVKRLSEGKGKTAVPRQFVNGLIEICNMIDPTPRTLMIRKTDADGNPMVGTTGKPIYRTVLENEFTPEQIDEGLRNGTMRYTGESERERDATKNALLNRLRDVYDGLANSDDPDLVYAHDEEFSNYIRDLKESLGNDKPIRDMSRAELQQVYDAMKQVWKHVSDAKKLIGAEHAMSLEEARNKITRETKALPSKIGSSRFSDFEREWLTNPIRVMREMSGYNDDAELSRLFMDVVNGYYKGEEFRMKAEKTINETRKTKADKKNYKRAAEEGAVYMVDTDGNGFYISMMQAIQLILTYEREIANENHAHLEYTTYFPDLELMNKGDLNEAIRKSHKTNVADGELIEKLRKAVEKDEWATRFMEACKTVLREQSTDAMNETSMELEGVPIAREKAYIPYRIVQTYKSGETENVERNISVRNLGMTKRLVPNAKTPVLIAGIHTVLEQHIDDVAKYTGLAVPVRNWNAVFNFGKKANETPVVETLNDRWRTGMDVLQQAVADIQGPRGDKTNKLLSQMKTAFVESTLMANISVTIKQMASYPTAFAYLSLGSLNYGVNKFMQTALTGKMNELYDRIDEITPLLYMRRQGLSIQEIGELKHSKFNWLNEKLGVLSPANWIQSADVNTTTALFLACEHEVKKTTNPKSKDFNRKVKELYEKVLSDTQPMYDPLHRAEVSKDNFWKNILMFKTQPLQNSGILRDSIQGLRFAKAQYGKGSAQAKAAGRTFAKALTSQIATATVFVAMTAVANAVKHSMDRYRDDEDKELTWESFMKKAGTDLSAQIVSVILPVFGEIGWSVVEKAIAKNTYDVISNPTLDMINDTVTSFINLISKAKDGELDGEKVYDFVARVLGMCGVPLKNIVNIGKGIYLHYEDAVNKAFLSFEAGVELTSSQKQTRLYKALVSGDQAKIDEYKKQYKTEDDYHEAIRSALAAHDDRIVRAAAARYVLDVNEYKDIVAEIYDEEHFSKEDILKTIKSKFTTLRSGIKSATEAKENGWDEEYKKAVDALVKAGYDREFVEEQIGEVAYKEKPDWWEDADDDKDSADYYDKADAEAALKSGDANKIQAVYDDLVSEYVFGNKDNPENSARSDMKSSIKNLYQNGDIDQQTAETYLKKYAGLNADDVYWEMDKWNYAGEDADGDGEPDDYSKYYELIEAVGSGTDLRKVVRKYLDHGIKASSAASEITKYYKPLYKAASTAERARMKGYLLNAYELLGYKRTDKSKDIDKWLKD